MQESKNLRGLRGWLILIGIGLIVSFARMTYALLAVYYPLFTDGTFTALSTPGTTLYNPLWAPILISEALISSLFAATYTYLIYLFITEHYRFPRVYIATVLVSAVFIPLDAWVCSLVLVDEPIFDASTTKELARTLITLFVWVPYMLVSKRVKATFVMHRPEPADARSAVTL
ncbi:DUF2569 domain-containing protein [Pseudomonas allii]|uniref:DUF2569 domain-containing protein n=2 Tax=Pseudomonas allii TaxID=2740531 RepID=A0ACC6LL05_9PSED|nr:DUF2569 domain-containing protein [Pseudomonas allii]KTB61760.1 hypothetical protein AO066_26020 [Pseudomonas fluorescens]MDR9879208.1 DUF2569 domain-containing protein [Pseudomonas allii]NWN46448.1 DUF2569 domain-containing protein [Pseudomonas allii]NWN59705.1 DUF2569 domain-containing protein [Pseudomonas allii]RMP71819.1 hypothetical protein ALQ17_00662 [Pseudomonas fluorescens]